MIMKKISNIILTILVFTSFQACQKSDQADLGSEKKIISDTWMRPGVKNRNSAAFMKITNNTNSPDTLFSIKSDLAQLVELHETYVKEGDMKGMRHIELLPIPANSTVELKPGSYHVMLIGLNNDLNIGNSGKIELGFKIAGNLAVDVLVK